MSVSARGWTSTSVAPMQTSSTREFLRGIVKKVGSLHFVVNLPSETAPDVLDMVHSLRTRPPDEESGFVPPTSAAALETLVLLSILKDAPPVTGISDDGCGGLEVYWMGASRHVQLNVPPSPSETPMVFWDGDGEYSLEPIQTPDLLRDRLRWFQAG